MITVLHITGWGRSGSTLLGNMLGSMEGFVHVGEFQWAWSRGVIGNGLCGCGQPFHECDVWRAIFEEAYEVSSIGEFDGARVAQLLSQAPRNREVARRYVTHRGTLVREREEIASEQLAEFLRRAYRAVRTVTGARVIVDSSKTPSYAHLIGGVPGLDVFIVHLVRDARACAYSWMKEVLREDAGSQVTETMERFPPIVGTLKWGSANIVAELIGRARPERYLRVRYEDVMAAPSEVVSRIAEFVGERGGFEVSEDNAVSMGLHHTVWGNPSRMRTGCVHLRLDDRWRWDMSPALRAQVALLSLPLLRRYGYV